MFNQTQLPPAGKTMIEKLRALDAQRQKERQKRMEERTDAADPRESIEEFLKVFEEARKQIDGDIRDVVAGGARPTGSAEADSAKAQLDALATSTAELEGQVSAASYFLPPYEQRSCANSIASLKQQIDEARTAVLPKKKFAFSKREGSTRNTAASSSASLASAAAEEATAAPAPSPTAPAAVEPAPLPTFPPGMGLAGVRGGVTCLGPADLDGKDYTLCDVDGGDVYLLGTFRAVRLHRIRNARIFLGPVKGSCFVEDVRNCEVHVASNQIRVHSTFDTALCMRPKSRPIIEHCERIMVCPYGLTYPALQAQLTRCQLDQELDMWREVDDFGWIKAVRSPNWDELSQDKFKTHQVPADLVTSAFPPAMRPAAAAPTAMTTAKDTLGDDDEL